jgi:F-type H+-transporting ATPase subunit delta
MQGASRQSLAAVSEQVAGRPGVGSHATGSQLLAVAGVLSSQSALRNALTDTGTSPQRRAALVDDVFGAKVDDVTQDVLRDVVRQRWSRPRDLVEGVELLGAEALLAHAEAHGRIDTVEEQLFRVSRLLESSGDLQTLLSDPAVTPAVKAAVVSDLLTDRAEPETVELVVHLVRTSPGGEVDQRLDAVVELAARRREQLLADVRVPMALSEEQTQRLGAALARLYSQPVSVAVTVDETLLGGAVVRVGDEIIDGSVASRLAAARRTLTQ